MYWTTVLYCTVKNVSLPHTKYLEFWEYPNEYSP